MTITVKMTQTRIGDAGATLTAGQQYALRDDLARQLVGQGYATDVYGVIGDSGDWLPAAALRLSTTQLAALADAGTTVPTGTLLSDPTTGLIYGQSDGAGSYQVIGSGGSSADLYRVLALSTHAVGGELVNVPGVGGSGANAATQYLSRCGPGTVLESIYTMTVGTGALVLYDSGDGSTTAANEVFRIPTPAAYTLVELDRPIAIRHGLVANQTALGTHCFSIRGAGTDMPMQTNGTGYPISASGIVSSVPIWVSSVRIVATGSSGSFDLRDGLASDSPALVSIPYGSLTAGQIIRFAKGPSRFGGGLYVTLPGGGGSIVVNGQPTYRA